MRPVNLLPEGDRPRRSTGDRPGSSYARLGVLGLLLVAAVVYVLTANQVTSRQAEMTEARADAQRAQARAAQLQAFGNFAQVARTRVASVKQLATGRFDWERFMRELALVLPNRSYLTEVDANVTSGAEQGAAGDGGSAAQSTTGGRVAKIVGCAPRQADVARMMVRLRSMYRVEDVTLKEAALDEQGQQQGSGAGGGGQQGNTGCGDSYEFELGVAFTGDSAKRPEAPVGKEDVPARLGGGQ
jgi:Tfp pilus assembly protein PilN